MSACLPSPLSLYVCTQAYTICKCCSDSLKFIRTSTIALHLCLPQHKSAVPYPQFMGSCPLGGCSSRLLQYLSKLSTEELRTELRTSLTSSTSLLIHITAWHLFPYHSAAYDGGSFRKQPRLSFSGSVWLRAVEKEQVGRGRESVMEHCGISPCQPHLLLMPALSKWAVCRGEMHWCSFMSDPWFLSHRSNILYLIQDDSPLQCGWFCPLWFELSLFSSPNSLLEELQKSLMNVQFPLYQSMHQTEEGSRQFSEENMVTILS